MRKLLSLLLVASAVQVNAQAQEICGDGIDNNVNGLWDCADPGCLDACGDSAFVCQSGSDFYQIRQGNQLWHFDGGWNQVTPFADRGFTVNAIGYNTRDGFMYGIRASTAGTPTTGTNELLRISKKGISRVDSIAGLPKPVGANQFYHTGDFNQSNGLLYVTLLTYTKMYAINLATRTATAITASSQYDVADFAYLPATQAFYGMRVNTNILRRVNMNGTFVDYTISGFNGTACGQMGAAFADASGNIYVSCNASGAFFKFTKTAADYSAFSYETILASSASPNNNDGGSCPFSIDWPEPPMSCCAEVLEILKGMQPEQRQASSDSRQELDALKEELKAIKEEKATRAVLHQNRPNPFNERTYVEYEIMDTYAGSASISVFNMNGVLHRTYPVPVVKAGQLIIEAGSLKPGMYLYTLIVDDQEADTKRMIMLE